MEDQRPSGPPDTRTGSLPIWLVTVLFLLIALVATWPLVAHFTTQVPWGANDLYQNLWGFWWWKTAIVQQHTSPFYTGFLYAPEGLNLAFHTHSPLNMIVTMPVNILFGELAAYNTSVLLAVFLCGLGGYLLCRELVRDEIAAFAGGLIFALFPQHQEQLFEHLNLFSCQFIPFTLLFLVRTFRYGRLMDGLLTGLFFALNALYSWHLGLLLILLGAPVFIWFWIKSQYKAKSLLLLLLGAILCSAVLAPFLWPMAKAYSSGNAYFVKPTVNRPVDPAFLALPPPQSTLTGSLTHDTYLAHRGDASSLGTAFKFQYAGFICFLGWVPVLLLIWLLFTLRRREQRGDKILWLALFVVFLLFSMGKWPMFLGGTWKGITLPQAWTQNLPGFRVIRVANRYLIPGSLAFAVLCAMGISLLPKSRILKVVPAVLILAEFIWVPFPAQGLTHHPYMKKLAKAENKGIVLEVPPCTKAVRVDNMIHQTQHGTPLLGGYAACVPPSKRKELKSFLGGLAKEDQRPWFRRRLIRELKEKGVRTVIVEKKTREQLESRCEKLRKEGKLPFFFRHLKPVRAFPEDRVNAIAGQFQRYLGPPGYEDKKLLIWRLKEEAERL